MVENNCCFPDSVSISEMKMGCLQWRPLIVKLANFLLMLLRSFLIAVVIVSIGSYIALSPPVLTRLYPGLILCPAKTDLSEYKAAGPFAVKPQDVYFNNRSGKTLHGWFFQSKNPQAPVVLWSHGNGGNIALNSSSVDRMLALGVSIFAYDYQGYGKSAGKPTIAGALADGEAAYDYLVNTRKVNPQRIVLYGCSFGGAVACHIAECRNAGGLVLESTFSSLLSAGKKRVPFFEIYPDFLQPYPALNNAAILKSKRVPLLIVHNVQDGMIPLSEAETNYAMAAQPKSLLVLRDSSHNFMTEADWMKYQGVLKEFIAQISM